MTINKRLVGAFLALVALSAALWATLYYSHRAGYAQGLTDYHNMCYHYGGMVIIEEKVVMCQPLTALPKEEVPLDKGRKV